MFTNIAISVLLLTERLSFVAFFSTLKDGIALIVSDLIINRFGNEEQILICDQIASYRAFMCRV